MRRDDRERGLVEVLVSAKQIHRVPDMRLDVRELRLIERSRLAQHLVVDLHLADVLQQAGHAQLADFRTAQADEACEHHRMHRDVHRMVVGVLVGALEPAQPQQRVGVALDAGGHFANESVDALDVDRAIGVDRETGLAQDAIDVVDDRRGIQQLGLEPAAPVLAADARNVRQASGVDLALEAARDLEKALRLDARLGHVGMLARPAIRTEQRTVLFDDLGAELIPRRTRAIDYDLSAALLQGPDLFDVLEQKALHHEGGFGPGAVDLDDIHADLEIARRYRLVQGVTPM